MGLSGRIGPLTVRSASVCGRLLRPTVSSFKFATRGMFSEPADTESVRWRNRRIFEGNSNPANDRIRQLLHAACAPRSRGPPLGKQDSPAADSRIRIGGWVAQPRSGCRVRVLRRESRITVARFSRPHPCPVIRVGGRQILIRQEKDARQACPGHPPAKRKGCETPWIF